MKINSLPFIFCEVLVSFKEIYLSKFFIEVKQETIVTSKLIERFQWRHKDTLYTKVQNPGDITDLRRRFNKANNL